jgi:hypothetical protein
MGATASHVRRSYVLHGIGLEVVARDAAVTEAIDLRLRDFRVAGRLVEQPLTVEFFARGEGRSGAERTELPATGGRPVYDTPYGTLRYFPAADLLGGELDGVRLCCDAGRGAATISASAFTDRSLYFATHPLTTIALMELMERRNLFSLHAGCLAGRGSDGVLLSGPSGAGKSTLTLALVRAGMRFLSDDVVFLARDHDHDVVSALGFADTIGLTGYAAERFGELRDRLAAAPAPGFPKRLGRIEDLFGSVGVASCEPRAIIFPEVTPDEPSELSPLDPGDALLRLVPDVLLTDAAATQAHLDAIAALLRQVRCYTLRSGHDLERATELVCELV